MFTAHDRLDGADAVIKTLEKQGINANFFFTGEVFEHHGGLGEAIV